MKKSVQVIPVFFLIFFIQSCSHKEYAIGTYQDTAVVADGELNEWNLPLRFGSSTGLVQYNITNDKENIYVSLQTHDEATAIKILRAGVNIYIDPAAGHSKKIDLAFPLPSTPSFAGVKNNNGNTVMPDRNEMKNNLLIQANTFKTTGFQDMEDKLYDVSDKSKIKVAIKYSADNSLGYEAIIPLKSVYKDGSLPKEKNSNLSVAVQINAMNGGSNTNRQNSNGNSNYSGGGMRGGGSGRRGGMSGGMGGGRRSGNYNSGENNTAQSSDRSTMNKADVNWYSFKLALKNN